MPACPPAFYTSSNYRRSPAAAFVRSFVRQSLHARQFPSAQELQRSTASGRNMRNLVGHSRFMHCGHRIAPADNRRRARRRSSRNRFGNLECPPGERRHFKDAHRPVPHNRFGLRDFRLVRLDRFRPDIQAHLIRGRRAGIHNSRRSARLKLWSDHMVDRQQKLEILPLCVRQDLLRQVKLVILHQRLADRHTPRFEKRVRHPSPDQHRIGDPHQVFDNFNLVAHLRATQDRHERPRWVAHSFPDVDKLLFHQQPGRRLTHEFRDAHNRSMRAVSRPERVRNKHTIAQGRQLFRERFIVLLFFRVEAHIFEARTSPSLSALLLASASAPTQSAANATALPSNSSSFFAAGFSEYFASGPPFGLPRWDASTNRPSFSIASFSVGSVSRMRVSSVTTPSFRGTLKSTRMKTRFPRKSSSLIVSLFMMHPLSAMNFLRCRPAFYLTSQRNGQGGGFVNKALVKLR